MNYEVINDEETMNNIPFCVLSSDMILKNKKEIRSIWKLKTIYNGNLHSALQWSLNFGRTSRI